MRTVTIPKYPGDFYKEGGLIDIDCVRDEIRYQGKAYSYDEWEAFVLENDCAREPVIISIERNAAAVGRLGNGRDRSEL